MAAMVNMSNLLNGKDSRWLQLEVCREFQRNKCSRPDTECKFAHPPANVEVQNGRVTACYDSIKGRCQREKPPCKYFHPPQHLKDQLLINGRNHLALKNALMQQMGMAPPTPAPTIISSPLQPMTANRFLPASNPYNPYFTTGALLPTAILGPEHAATALASTSPMPQAVSLAAATTNSAAQQQKRTDRVQSTPTSSSASSSSSSSAPASNGNQMTGQSSVPLLSSASLLASFVEGGKKRTAECLQMNYMKLMNPYYHNRFMFPGLLPYKRPTPDKPSGGGMQALYHQPSAAAYQQLMQLQSAQQSAAAAYVPVSSHQNSICQSSPSSKAIIIPSTLDNIKNAVATSNCTATAVAASDDGDDTENALSLQNTKSASVNANGHDAAVVGSTTSNCSPSSSSSSSSSCDLIASTTSMVEENNNKSIGDLEQQQQLHTVIDEATKASLVQASIDESNLNAISFNSATSSSPAVVTTSAIYTTSSITTASNNNNSNNNVHSNSLSNNNSILSRKNSLTTSQHFINGSGYGASGAKSPYVTSASNTGAAGKLPDGMSDLLNASNPHLLSAAVFYNQPYQQLALATAASPNLYSDPAQYAKEMAQKNYANALKYAAVTQQQSSAVAGKSPSAAGMNALSYSGVALSAAAGGGLQAGTSTPAPRLPSPMGHTSSTHRPQYLPAAAAAALSRPMQNPYQSAAHSFIRPPMQHVNLANANPYFAAAAHQQFLQQQQQHQQNLFYSGLASPMASAQLTAVTSGASSHMTTSPYASSAAVSYSPFGAQTLQAMHGLPASMMQVPHVTSQASQSAGSGATVVLNPYKKMKTS